MSSFWCAITLTWVLSDVRYRPEEMRNLRSELAVCTLVGVLVWGLLFLLLGVGGLGAACSAGLLPLAHVAAPLAKEKVRPTYEKAIARLKFGRYKDAELEILQELDGWEDDFDGWMMLAELYATQFKELSEADRTIRALCDEPGIIGVQISVAFHRLADWHLKLGSDPMNARRALQEISRRLPDSHFSKMAQLRIQQLPADREELLEQLKPKTLRLSALRDPLDESPITQVPIDRVAARTLAHRYVERLKENPNDALIREKFAVVLADQLDQDALAIEQLELLLDMPDQPEEKSAERLAMIAAWQLRDTGNKDKAKAALERIVRQFPKSRQAFTAQRWLVSRTFSSVEA